jgi:hypothetical protein
MTGRGKARLSAEKVAEIFMASDSENDLFDDSSDDSSVERDPARGRGRNESCGEFFQKIPRGRLVSWTSIQSMSGEILTGLFCMAQIRYFRATGMIYFFYLVYLFLIRSGRPRQWHYGCPLHYTRYTMYYMA